MTGNPRATLRRGALLLPLVASIVCGVSAVPRAAGARPSLAELQAAVCHLYAFHLEPLPPGLVSECLGGKLVFVSSAVYNGALGGLAGADAACNTLASAAGLPGTFKAWLSDTNSGPDTRFAQSSLPYKLIDQTLVANDWADLTDGQIENPIDLDEYGAPRSGSVWSNTNADGSPQNDSSIPSIPDNCGDWSIDLSAWLGAVGTSGETSSSWSSSFSYGCGSTFRLYCFEQ